MNLVSMLDSLQAHPVLCNINLNTVIQCARLIGHLKQDILLPQPLNQSNVDQPPEILPPSIAEFLAAVTDIATVYVQDMWDLLKEHLWNSPVLAFVDEDFELFKSFGWQRGLSE